MNTEQITNIAIKIGEISQKADFTLLAAVIAAAGAVIAAVVTGYVAWKANKAEKEHQKQWAYLGKKSALIDSAIDVAVKMMFNKLALVYYRYPQAYDNLFILQKEGLVIESQLVVYGSADVAAAFSDFTEQVISCPNEQFVGKWGELYKKGQEYLELCRVSLGVNVTEPYKKFAERLAQPPAREDAQTAQIVAANTMGGVSPLKVQ
jgi:hypothetical protein